MSFRVDAGSIVGFVGSNGAGKTTTMRVVMGVERADSGEVRWRGAPIGQEERRRFGYMPEERGLYPKMRALDEPFSGLDPVGVDALAGVLREAADAGTPILFSSHQLDLVERLCDAVAIIDKGRVLASGSVSELRTNDERRLRVGVRNGQGRWIDGIDGVDVVERHGDEVVLLLTPDVDDQALLDRARRAGAVTTFADDTPSLAERYRQVVNA